MNAFASDLDRTLIFSQRMLAAYGSDGNEECIELLDGKPISYISPKTKEGLKEIHEDMCFIPVTTRTIEQYKRIQLFQEDIVPEYAITSNGGTILKRGEVLKEWTLHVEGMLRNSTPLEEMMKKVTALDDTKWIKKIKPGDGVFFYIILHTDRFSSERFSELKKLSDHVGWQMSLQGRKLYFIPKVLTKWTALRYLREELGLKDICTAGDSILDLELITNGTYGIAPLHGEVLEKFPSLHQTKEAGIKASEEIVEKVQSRYRNVEAI
ncbi:HAD family hydrolase [Rossellomorea vietnamensis]|uniref:HAD family hydrolase n=1 Tax=Rossellomorea vietnamensis TaxID=218284 RepID=UPI001E34A8C6|nr:HAD family hydrolase [Rossellomorea vietnamensis]MCC5804359.1 hydrolase (had superfamily) [Rossellomorea vietnamensis]